MEQSYFRRIVDLSLCPLSIQVLFVKLLFSRRRFIRHNVLV